MSVAFARERKTLTYAISHSVSMPPVQNCTPNQLKLPRQTHNGCLDTVSTVLRAVDCIDRRRYLPGAIRNLPGGGVTSSPNTDFQAQMFDYALCNFKQRNTALGAIILDGSESVRRQGAHYRTSVRSSRICRQVRRRDRIQLWSKACALFAGRCRRLHLLFSEGPGPDQGHFQGGQGSRHSGC
jgi:hypothetical protein